MDDVKNKDLDQQRIFQPSGKEPRGKLNCYDWLADVPGEKNVFDMVEVQFKNTRKGYYRNSMNLPRLATWWQWRQVRGTTSEECR